MRLSPDETSAIKSAAAEIFGPCARVTLFGSRVDEARRGGDIDLLVEVEAGENTFGHEIRFASALEKRLGERKIDIVLHPRGAAPEPIVRLALRDGVAL